MMCTFCEYQWETRKENPKACPRCKRRFDYKLILSNREAKYGKIKCK